MSHRHMSEDLVRAIAEINAQMQARVLNPTPLHLWSHRDFAEPEPPPNVLHDTGRMQAKFRYAFLREATNGGTP